jgi:FAD/FMN-containing dehydrogenase
MNLQPSIFQDILPSDRIITGADLNERYCHIWRMDQSLKCMCALLPVTTQEVSEIMKICTRELLPVVVHGGLTNLVGSTETDGNEVVLSLEKLNNIEEVDADSRTITAQAGVILEHVQDTAQEKGLLFPLNFGAKGSAQVGGIISTNAGGLRVLKYGMTRHLVLGLEVVLADGRIISSMKKIIKDNSAYDLKQNFIGSEGTLGIVTRAVLKLVEAPKARTAVFMGVDNYLKVVSLLKKMDGELSGKLSGFELIWKNSYIQMTSTSSAVRPPLPYDYNYYVLAEIQDLNTIEDQESLQSLLENLLNSSIIEDASIAQTENEVNWFFRIREDVNNLTDHMKYDQHFDISIPIPLIGEYIEECYKNLGKIELVDQIYAFGHVADGNIHLMIGKQNNSLTLKKEIDHVVYAGLKEIGGSVSAEHGIGRDKKDYLKLCRSKEEIALMKSMKQFYDPNNLLNRANIF